MVKYCQHFERRSAGYTARLTGIFEGKKIITVNYSSPEKCFGAFRKQMQ